MAPTVLVEISQENADDARLDQLSRQLLDHLRKHGLQAGRATGRAPAGAKSGAAVAVASLLVALAGTPAMKAFVNGMFAWLGPRRASVKVSCGDSSIELSAATAEEQRELIEWLRTCHQETPDRDGREG